MMTTMNPAGIAAQAHTKVVATVGPACSAQDKLIALVEAGVDVFRVNMAHGDRSEHEDVIRKIRIASQQLNVPIGILVDLAGPKIRLGELPNDAIECHDGEEFRFIRAENSSEPNVLGTTYPQLIDEVVEKDHILLADGTVDMLVIGKDQDSVTTKVVQSGLIRSRQGVNLPGVHLSVHALTEEDRDNAKWAAKNEVDFLGMSFVRTADEIEELKELLQDENLPTALPKIVAKIEKREALDQLEEIVQAADGVMVARGDLGVETDVARLAVEQKRIIKMCTRYQKPVITATQMLDSMQYSKHPTRAEATDVANAILDGTDACMLSGETAVGKYPELAVRMMDRIAAATEPLLRNRPPNPLPDVRPVDLTEITQIVAYNAGRIAEDLDALFIVCSTHTGATALALSAQRRFVPVIGVSDQHSTLRKMTLYWGVYPLLDVPTTNPQVLIQAIEDWGHEGNLISNSDLMVLLASNRVDESGHNSIMVHEVGSHTV